MAELEAMSSAFAETNKTKWLGLSYDERCFFVGWVSTRIMTHEKNWSSLDDAFDKWEAWRKTEHGVESWNKLFGKGDDND